jgi:hypothetical protein
MNSNKIEKDVELLRSELEHRIEMFKHVEEMMDESLVEATDSGYRLGWVAGLMAAMESLEKLKMKDAAQVVFKLIERVNSRES